ncbi:MAG: hypothetical protein KDL31_00180 [Kiritimatiellae bacterium]|nr:hypothetical protein [Kiritimatiellia bacterium]
MNFRSGQTLPKNLHFGDYWFFMVEPGTTLSEKCSRQGNRLLCLWGAVFSVATVSAVQAVEFGPARQIANDRIINREPVISGSGLAAWMSYNSNDLATANTFISIYSPTDGMRGLTEELGGTMYAAAKPVAQSNQIVFIANYRSRDHVNTSWTLREVPTRDENFPELDARFIAKEDGGVQTLVPLVDREGLTNATESADTTEAPANNSEAESTSENRRVPSGESEIWSWVDGAPDVTRITTDYRNDYAPSVSGDILAWQKAKGFPFGWEIMALVGDNRMQLTTNFYYDMAPQVQGRDIVWYGWDGYDYEIFLYNADKNETIQITDNRFDDVGPMVWNGAVVWESYPAVEADILLYRDGEIQEISDNLEDDISPRIWDRFVVWQGFDGDDFELWLYDMSTGNEAIKLTSNDYDDVQPSIMDGLLVWMAYVDNWDAEIYYLDLTEIPYQPKALTENEDDDLDPQTAGRRVIWRTERDGRNMIMLAEPKP